MTVKDRIKKTVSNIDPDGVKKFAEVSQDTIEKAQGLSQRVKREQQQVESEEADLNSTENEVEDDLRAEEDEITEGEQEGNPAEIEDAEKKMEQILDLLKKEERETDDIEKKLEDELKTEADEINIEERMESTAEKDFKQAAKELEDVLTKLKKYQDSKGKIDKQSLFTEIEDALQEIRYSAELFRRVLKYENDLMRQLEETKEEEMNLENLVSRLEELLNIDKKEIKQLIRDSEKLQIESDVKEAKKEGNELSQLLQHVEDEESEVGSLENELQNEIKELGKVLGEDEKILDEMRACRQLLVELEDVMEDEKGLIAFGGNSRQAKKVLKDVDKTDQVLKKMLNEDGDFIEALEKNYDKLTGKSTSIGRSILTSRTTWLIIGAIIFVILAIGLYQGNT